MQLAEKEYQSVSNEVESLKVLDMYKSELTTDEYEPYCTLCAAMHWKVYISMKKIYF
jgi:hypothetical protein